MKFNHVANRVDPRYFDTVVAMLKANLGFIELRRNERAIWLRQPGANVDLQLSRCGSDHRDDNKNRSQVSFLSETPRADLEILGGLGAGARHASRSRQLLRSRILHGRARRLRGFRHRGDAARTRRLRCLKGPLGALLRRPPSCPGLSS